MTPRTSTGVAASATASAAAPPRPASGLKTTKKSPSPPPSRQAEAKPPTAKPSEGLASAVVAIPSTLPEFVELFLAKATSGPASKSSQQLERLWSNIDWTSSSSADTAASGLGSAVAALAGDGHLVLNVIPNEVQVNIAPCAAPPAMPSCDVVVSAGAAAKQLCRTEGGDTRRILLTPLNHAGGPRDALPVMWAEGLNWSVDAADLRLSGSGACPTGGAAVQRGCVTIKTAANGTSATVTVAASTSGGNSSKVAVVSAELATTFGGQQPIEECFTHAGDESLTTFKLAPAASSDTSSKQRPPSGSVEARRRKARVSVMDNLAQYDGEIDVLSKRFLGRGVFSITTGSSTSSKYDGEWLDSLRHGAKSVWSVALPSSAAVSSSGVSSVEYSGPFHNDARHGKAGRLTIRKQSATGGVHIDADWDHGELDGQVTLSSVDDTQTIVSCGFAAGTVAPNVTLTFPSGAFIGKWLNPKSVASAAVALAASTPSIAVAAGGQTLPPPMELLQQSTSGVHANVSKAADAMGAVDCVIQSIANPLLADQIRGPVAEFLASRVACDLSRVSAVATIAKSQRELREKQLEGIKSSLKDAQARFNEQQQLLLKAEKKRAGLLAERDKAASAMEKLVQQRDATTASLEGGDGGNSEGVEKMKLAQQALRALGLEKLSVDQQISELNEQIALAKAETKKLALKRDASAKDLKAIEAEVAQISEKMAGVASSIEAQTIKLAAVEHESDAALQKLEGSKQGAQEQLALLQRQLANINDNETGGNSTSPESIEALLKELKVSISDLKKQIEDAEHLKAAEEARKLHLSNKVSSDMKLREELRAELTRLTAGVEASKSALISKRQEIETMGVTLAELEAAFQKDSDDSLAASRDPEDHVTKRRTMESELEKLNEILAQGRTLMTRKMMELDALRITIEALESELKEAKLIKMKPPVVAEPASPERKQSIRSPAPPTPPPRTATPPPDPRIGDLESSIKQALTKQDGFRRKKENINDRIDQLAKQKVMLQEKMERKTKSDADEAALRTSSSVAVSQDGGLNAMLLDGSIPELKAFLSKMKEQNSQYEAENQTLRSKLDAITQSAADAKRQAANSGFPAQQSSGVDWRTKALQDEVDAREGRISALRSELKRTHLLEAKIQSAKESIKTLTQSAELRQTQAVQMAKADMDWTSSVTLARKASSGRNAFF
jgi:hypothetical protein